MTAQEDFQAFLDAQKEADYDFESMTQEEKDAEMLEYTRLKILAEQEKKKIADFAEYEQAEEIKMRDAQNQLEADFRALMTAKKEAGYDIDYVPVEEPSMP